MTAAQSATKQDVAKRLAARWGVSYSRAESLLSDVLEEVADVVAESPRCNLPPLGVFDSRTTKAREVQRLDGPGRVTLPAVRRVGFRPSRNLRDAAKAKGGTS